ncbi:MAG TPA: AraC family transcriptional regulator [Longimicrobiales bacterium]|nr:AraC family transcriptional regulator [Longimicrobiales bacterium]
MDFEFFATPPSPRLAPFIEIIWAVRGATDYVVEAIPPNGAIELMINFGPTQKVLAYGEQRVDQNFERFWVAGLQERSLTIASPHGCDHMGVRFKPGGAHAFFELPMHDVSNQVIDLDLLLGASAAAELYERLSLATSHAARCALIEHWLLTRRYAVHPYYATTRKAIDILQSSGFRVSVNELCYRLGLSNRHLIEQFRRVVGVTPKSLSRITRFNSVVRAIRHDDDPAWPALAYRFNFADQAHLVREFKHYSGVTPMEFVANRSPDHAHVVVDAAY